MAQATSNLASLSNNFNFRQDVVEESFKELGRRIERGAYYEKGRKEGIKEGEIKGKIEASLDIRFGTRGLEHIQKIRPIQDLEKLQAILTLARNAKSIEEFEEGLSSCL